MSRASRISRRRRPRPFASVAEMEQENMVVEILRAAGIQEEASLLKKLLTEVKDTRPKRRAETLADHMVVWEVSHVDTWLQEFKLVSAATRERMVALGVDGATLLMLLAPAIGNAVDASVQSAFFEAVSLTADEGAALAKVVAAFNHNPVLPSEMRKTPYGRYSLANKDLEAARQWLALKVPALSRAQLDRMSAGGFDGHCMQQMTRMEPSLCHALFAAFDIPERETREEMLTAIREFDEVREEKRMRMQPRPDYSHEMFDWLPVFRSRFEMWETGEVLDWMSRLPLDSGLNDGCGNVHEGVESLLYWYSIDGWGLALLCGALTDPKFRSIEECGKLRQWVSRCKAKISRKTMKQLQTAVSEAVKSGDRTVRDLANAESEFREKECVRKALVDGGAAFLRLSGSQLKDYMQRSKVRLRRGKTLGKRGAEEIYSQIARFGSDVKLEALKMTTGIEDEKEFNAMAFTLTKAASTSRHLFEDMSSDFCPDLDSSFDFK